MQQDASKPFGRAGTEFGSLGKKSDKKADKAGEGTDSSTSKAEESKKDHGASKPVSSQAIAPSKENKNLKTRVLVS